jgi:hypothetical protein
MDRIVATPRPEVRPNFESETVLIQGLSAGLRGADQVRLGGERRASPSSTALEVHNNRATNGSQTGLPGHRLRLARAGDKPSVTARFVTSLRPACYRDSHRNMTGCRAGRRLAGTKIRRQQHTKYVGDVPAHFRKRLQAVDVGAWLWCARTVLNVGFFNQHHVSNSGLGIVNSQKTPYLMCEVPSWRNRWFGEGWGIGVARS